MKIIHIHPSDNVAVALRDLLPGEELLLSLPADSGEDSGAAQNSLRLPVLEAIPRGHKIALKDIPEGSAIIKYGYPIAAASAAIPAGSWVHTHNARTQLSENAAYHYHHQVFESPRTAARTFNGYLREDGRAGIRNELWILPLVGCVNGIAKQLETQNQDLVSGAIDGLWHFEHPYGCSQLGEDLKTTGKLLAALSRHPNAGGVLFVSLGCENLTSELFGEILGDYDPRRIRFLCCQEEEDELEKGRQLLRELADYASGFERTPLPVSKLVIGMKCGGSDGLSGITANPAVGRFSDRLIALGGSTVLTEVPEMFGAEDILFSRCRDQEVFDKAAAMVNDFKKYFTDHGQVVYENPSPGNKKGGITTLEDKSCGCVQKGGSAQIVDVLHYGDCVTQHGLNLLSGPGNDMVSATVLSAAGAHLILFTTGRGTPFGAPAPTVKISTNTPLFRKKSDWIDFNAGTIAEEKEDGNPLESLDDAGERLLNFVVETASGRKTLSEQHGCREIAIFKDGVTL